MTVVEKMAQAAMASLVEEGCYTRIDKDDGIGRCLIDGSGVDMRIVMQAALTAMHDSFADPVVRAAIQAALDEKEG